MISQKTTDELSPLDQIRQTESEVTRDIAVARESAEQIIATARNEVKELLEEVRTTGLRRGQTRYKEIFSLAEEEARGIVAQAQNRAEELRRKGRKRMATAVDYAVNLVIGLEGAGDRK
ncbi:MAG: hypothetical protein PVG14_01780 [Anaerolineales bacterium]